MHKCIIVIPTYKETLDDDELKSLAQCKRILKNYDIKFVCPESLNTSWYEKQWSIEFVRYDDKYFKSIYSYSHLLLTWDFYNAFSNYEFMLLYQLDAWVFRDELEEWCNKDYDYIGAPWFEGYSIAKPNSKMYEFAGNGGFSLRKISTFIDVLSKIENSEEKLFTFLEVYTKNGNASVLNIFRLVRSIKRYFSKQNIAKHAIKEITMCEDNIIANAFRRLYPDLKIAKAEDAKFFSFEVLPERLYEECSKKLPFGCHGYKKYNWDFWKEHIIESSSVQFN